MSKEQRRVPVPEEWIARFRHSTDCLMRMTNAPPPLLKGVGEELTGPIVIAQSILIVPDRSILTPSEVADEIAAHIARNISRRIEAYMVRVFGAPGVPTPQHHIDGKNDRAMTIWGEPVGLVAPSELAPKFASPIFGDLRYGVHMLRWGRSSSDHN